MHPIRLASHADIPALAAMLARAFDKDPFWRWMAGDGHDCVARMTQGFAVQLRHLALPGGLVWCGEQHQGASLWSAPGQWQLGLLDQLRLLPEFVQVAGWSRLWSVSRAIERVQQVHPTEPHYYLQVLGVDPACQGQGWSRPLLEGMLARADRESRPVYLETAEESNLSFYRRFGFDVSQLLADLPGAAPPLWCLWREPRASR
mgnify:CR=1 FL=1